MAHVRSFFSFNGGAAAVYVFAAFLYFVTMVRDGAAPYDAALKSAGWPMHLFHAAMGPRGTAALAAEERAS